MADAHAGGHLDGAADHVAGAKLAASLRLRITTTRTNLAASRITTSPGGLVIALKHAYNRTVARKALNRAAPGASGHAPMELPGICQLDHFETISGGRRPEVAWV